jgi:hypothetical protein
MIKTNKPCHRTLPVAVKSFPIRVPFLEITSCARKLTRQIRQTYLYRQDLEGDSQSFGNLVAVWYTTVKGGFWALFVCI